jgi:hypothetical protein
MNASILIRRPSWLAACSLRPCRIANKSSAVAFARINILADEPRRLPHQLRHYRHVWVSNRGVVTACWHNQPNGGGDFHWRFAAAAAAVGAVAVAATAAASTGITTSESGRSESTSWHVQDTSGTTGSTSKTTTQCCGIVGVVGGGVSEESDSNIPPLDTRYVVTTHREIDTSLVWGSCKLVAIWGSLVCDCFGIVVAYMCNLSELKIARVLVVLLNVTYLCLSYSHSSRLYFSEFLLQGLTVLKNRGYDSAGLATLSSAPGSPLVRFGVLVHARTQSKGNICAPFSLILLANADHYQVCQ